MYKSPLYFEEEKISIKNNKIIIFCIIIALITIGIVVVTGILAFKMIKNDQMLSETQTMTGTKTVGKGSYDNSAVNENTTIEENTEEQVVEQTTVTPETKTTTTKFPKHDYSVAMESQLPQYSDEIAKKVVDVYFEETKKVYLTFDDGPSVCTDDILDILDQYNVKATFFVLGSNVELYPGLVKRAYDSGHFIANHGYSHRYSQIYTSAQTVLDEYNQTVDAIRKAIGVDNYNPHLFRFPGGSSGGTYESIKREAIEVLKQNQITYTNWNCLTGDSAGSKTVEDMWNELNETSAGDDNLVILMHDAGDKQTTIEFLPQLIEYYQNQGYEFVNYYDVMCN